MAAVFLIIFHHVRYARATPVPTLETQIQQANGNITALNVEIAPSWATTPNIRGTKDLLWTSILTLSICVYTVVHLNVPPPDEGRVGFIIRKTRWVLISILAPEISLVMAIQQWLVARALSKDLTKLWNDFHSESSSDQEKQENSRKKFGMLYGHYAAMGGFVADVSSMHNSLTRVTLLPSAISELAKHGHFLEIDIRTIKDKSKADTLAKALVCVQVIWMIIQCIGRKVAGLPISLLEMHVLVHVACALCMYTMWMQKPFDVQEPTLVDSSKFKKILALMLMRSRISTDPQELEIYDTGAVRPTEQNIDNHTIEIDSSPRNLALDHPLKSTSNLSVNCVEESSEEMIVDNTVYRPLPKEWTEHCVYGVGLSKLVCTLYPGQSLRCGAGPPSSAEGYMQLSSEDVLRWTLASDAMKDHPEIYQPGTHKFSYTKVLSEQARNFADIGFPLDIAKAFKEDLLHSPLFWLMLLVCPLAYGGVHFAATSFHFPTPTEQLLWKIASLFVMFGIPGGIVYIIVGICIPLDLLVFTTFPLEGRPFMALWLIFLIPLLVLVLAYSFARIFLIIESFISVRYLPIGVYVTIDWSNYIPHL